MEREVLRKVLKFLKIVLLEIIRLIIVGFVLFKLWNWCLVQILNLQLLSFFEAIGVVIIVDFLINRKIVLAVSSIFEYDADFYVRKINYFGDLILSSLYVLIVGWVIHLII